jgi:hypothetical protein
MRFRISTSSGGIPEAKFRFRAFIAHLMLKRFDVLMSRAGFWQRLSDDIYASINYQMAREEFAEDALREINSFIDNLEEDEEE